MLTLCIEPLQKSKMAFVCMENISAYTKACKAVGLPVRNTKNDRKAK